MPKVTVRVTRDILHWALTQSSTNCAVALALKESDDRFTHPKVDQETIRFTDAHDDVRYTIPTPKKIADYITAFDANPESVKPLTFTIDLDDPNVTVRPSHHATVPQKIKEAKRLKERREGVRKATGVPISHRPLRLE